MTDYFDIAATPSVLDIQAHKGSLGLYTREPGSGPGGAHVLSPDEANFIAVRDSFYVASVSETGWPYVQHRGGEPGFVTMVNPTTIGWTERNGNRQYIGTGNISHNGRVAAIFMDYPNRSRLKIYGHATYHPDPSDELLTQLGGADTRNDGAITIEVLATNWNCPKYITPRYTEAEVASAVAPLQARIAELEAQLA